MSVPFGVTTIKKGGIDGTTGLPTSLATVGKILRNTADFTQADPTKTEHYSELNESPEVVLKRQGKKSFKFTLMELVADTILLYMGGTVVTTVADDEWFAPATTPTLEASFELTLESGHVLTIYRGDISAKIVGKPTKEGLFNLEVTVDALVPNVGAIVGDISIADPLAA